MDSVGRVHPSHMGVGGIFDGTQCRATHTHTHAVVSSHDTLKNRDVAIKKVANFLRDLDDAKRIAREIKLLKHLSNHPGRCPPARPTGNVTLTIPVTVGIIKILDVMTSPPNTSKNFSDVYIVCPLMVGIG